MAALRTIFDNHIHLRAGSRGVEAAKDFERAGGTAFMLTHTPYGDVPVRGADDFRVAYGKTLAMAEAVRRTTSVQVFVAVGPYPVEFLHLADSLGLERAVDATQDAVDAAGRLVRDGVATAIGEVGRPHFPVPIERLESCNRLLEYTLSVARDVGCAVVLHTEDPTADTFAEFAAIADRAGFDRRRIVKHHSTPLTRPEENRGIVPSILAKETLVAEALRGAPRFLLETDYIDDPRRPGAVLGPATVPRKTLAWLRDGLLTEDVAAAIHETLPEQTYDIELS